LPLPIGNLAAVRLIKHNMCIAESLLKNERVEK
jgi:hypothetical protein